jgi:citrate lyase gamma subunit
MSLPKIDAPTYELTLPSSDRKIKYRPFLVKEEKLLIIAMESENMHDIANAIKQVLENCILTRGIKIEKLSTFDIEYLFLNVRGKSVGESVEVLLTCPDDGETQVATTIALSDIRVQKDPEHTNIIKLNDEFSLKMRYPSLEEFVKENFDAEGIGQIEQSFEMIAKCIEQVYNEEESWAASDHTTEEMVEFVEGLGSSAFKEIEKFFTTMPKLTHTVKIKNPNTGVVSDVIVEGLASFFS